MVLNTFEYAGQSDSSENGSQDRVLGDDEAIQNLAHIGSGDRAVFTCGGEVEGGEGSSQFSNAMAMAKTTSDNGNKQ